MAKVSFSHQVEHLVNLDLIQPDENRKIAQNENLVTFTGRFREALSSEAAERFRYLELLENRHELTAEKERLEKELAVLQKNIADSARFFLEITGLPVPSRGFFVVSPLYDTPEKNFQIVILEKPKSETVSLKELKDRFQHLKSAGSFESAETLKSFANDLRVSIELFQSSKLGIGQDSLKELLRSQKEKLVRDGDLPLNGKIELYAGVLKALDEVVSELLQSGSNATLLPLRSVRSYLEDLQAYSELAVNLENSEALLNKARASVAQVSWFFNNKELSLKELESTDAESYKRWFLEAKKEWLDFNSNKALAFKAPDQERNTVLDKTFKSQ
ncbi:MAG: cell division protein FtsH, partial [Parachlamydiales bacterium]